jgi:hypothetical protein
MRNVKNLPYRPDSVPIMTYTVLQTILSIGRCLAVMPTCLKRSFSDKLFGACMFAFVSVVLTMEIYYKTPFYTKYNYIKLAAKLMGDGSFYIFAYYTMMVLRFSKRDQWCRLVQQMRNAATTETTYTNFVVVHVIFLSNMVYGIYLWSKILKSEFIKQFSIDMFLCYSKFLYNYLVYAVLKLILIRYKRLSEELLQFSHTTKHGRVKDLSFMARRRFLPWKKSSPFGEIRTHQRRDRDLGTLSPRAMRPPSYL